MSWTNSKQQEGKTIYQFTRWASWFFLVASILLFIYAYYRVQVTEMGFRYFKYYLIALTGILFWAIVLRLREDIRANIVTLVITLILGLYLVEVGLILLGLEQRQPSDRVDVIERAAELGVKYDERTKIQVIEELIADGIDAVPANRISDVMWPDFLPLSGISNKTTVDENESGRRMIYLSDRYGFNNPDSEWNSNKTEWLLLGDSFIEGVAVQLGEDIAGQIRVITEESSINLGRSGNGPLMNLAGLKEYAEVIKPKKVLWFYFDANDMEDLQNRKNNPILMKYLEDEFSQHLINRQKEIDERLTKYLAAEYVNKEKVQTQSKTLLTKTSWIRLGAIRNVLAFDSEVDIDYVLFTKILNEAKARIRSWGGEIYFVYLPGYGRYTEEVISHDRYQKKSEVIGLIKELNIPIIDIHEEVFADHPDPLALFPLRLSGHYNADGYSKVAKAIVISVNKYEQSNK
jgi:lysophospholipase L1-like esterase